jgi:peptidoglycan/xylan/chitin deacetylase (PgdA/CDA1 family)
MFSPTNRDRRRKRLRQRFAETIEVHETGKQEHFPVQPRNTYDMNALKRLYRRAVSTPGLIPHLLRKRDMGVIFMLHRFPDPELENEAEHDVGGIRSMLAYLRGQRFDLIPLATFFERAQNNVPLQGAVAFTIDDGYLDHARVGASLFAEFDCPSTTFLTTGFLDGQLWFWWDKIDYIVRATKRQRLEVSFGAGTALALHWSTRAERDAAQDSFTEACKHVSDAEKLAAIARLAEVAEVDLPAKAPKTYSPMSWDDARRCEQIGMTFGPHTVTHPILANTPDAQSEFEITESWKRVSSELTQPVSIFAYPNGQVGDFTERETRTLARIGLAGSVVGYPGYATGDDIRSPQKRFYVRRFGMPRDTGGVADVAECVTGIEHVKRRLRGAD